MADKSISNLTNMSGSASIDRTADFLEISDSTGPTSYKATPNFILGFTGGDPVSTTDTQTLTNKTLTSPTISGPTLSGTLTGTYTIGGTPTFPAAVVTLTGTQTLTNKTLTSPTINTATISNPTLTVDTISEHTSANGVVIDGVTLKDGGATLVGTLSVTGNSTLTGTLSTTGQLSVQTGTAPPASGASTSGIKFSSTANLGLYWGSGAPTFSAAQGSLYLRTDGSSSSTRAYINSNGSTTWVAVTTAS